MGATFIFLPDTLDLKSIGFLQGFSKQLDNLAFYIMSDKLVSKTSHIIGYCSDRTPEDGDSTAAFKDSEWIHVNSESGEVTIHNANDIQDGITCITYKLEEFKNCDRTSFKSQDYGLYFETLCDVIHAKPRGEVKFINSFTTALFCLDVIINVFSTSNLLFKHSSTITHFANSIATLKCTLTSMKDEGTMSLKVRSVIASKVLDIILGVVALLFILKYETQIVIYINKTVEAIIHNLKELLDVLMGSPIGLKLNHAFNTTLGIFFFYHISLWKVFVQFTRPLLYSALYFLLFPALLGLSFQTAIFEDLIKFCTIHVYCIYVYAARLYRLQIHALISLWRLFIGRKYNPLRRRVDSYEYSHHQLFIGTLGFTILLFLLPTTLLYYIVFTAFRLGLKVLNFILTYLRIYLQHLPVYVVTLWIFNSSSVAGTLVLKLSSIPEKKGEALTLHATLKVLPLWTSIKSTSPAVITDVLWNDTFRSLFFGEIL